MVCRHSDISAPLFQWSFLLHTRDNYEVEQREISLLSLYVDMI